jgi:membrane-associated HD superfamily phosphohydrolase
MRSVLYILCLIAAAAALRRIVALLLVGASSSAGQYAKLDRVFADHKSLTLAHIVPALLFVVLLPLWFSARVRGKEQAHRRLTTILFVLGFIVGLTAIPMVAHPVGGATELSAIIVFDGIFLFSFVRALMLFLRHEPRYREWMMRAIAVLLGIATTRPVMGVFFATARLTHLEPRQFFGIAFWIGFAVTYLAGEWYLQKHPANMQSASAALQKS